MNGTYPGFRMQALQLPAMPQRVCVCFAPTQSPDAEGPDDSSVGAKKRWYEEKQKRKAEELQRLGLDPSQAHR